MLSDRMDKLRFSGYNEERGEILQAGVVGYYRMVESRAEWRKTCQQTRFIYEERESSAETH